MPLAALVAATLFIGVPLAAQQKVPLVLNHLVLTLDSATYRDIANSDFVRDKFSAAESGFLNGPDGGDGMRLFGKYNFVQLVVPATKTAGAQTGDVGMVLAVERVGALDRLKGQGRFDAGGRIVSVPADGPVHANLYVESSKRLRPAGPDSTSAHTLFEIMEYSRDAVQHVALTDSQSLVNLSGVRFFRHNFDPTKLLSQLTGATLAIPVDDIAKIVAVLKRDNVNIVADGDGAIVKLDGFTLHLIPPYRGAGVKQLQFALTRAAVANPTYRFGPKSQLRFGPGLIAVWDFK